MVTLASVGLLVACGDIETTPLDDGARDGPGSGAERFVEDPYGIGSAWYDYDGSTHVLTPRPETYLLEEVSAGHVDGGAPPLSAWLLRLDS